MQILYIHQYFCPPGGSGNNRSLDLAREWVQAGHQVTMLTSAAYFPLSLQFQTDRKDLEVDGINVVALNVAYRHMMAFRERIGAFLKFYRRGIRVAKSMPRPDLIYASSTPPTVGEMGRKLARHWGVPLVFETVDVWPDVPIQMGIVRSKLFGNWLHSRVKRIYDAAALIVALSDGMKAQITAHGVPASKVMVSYNGTRLDAFPYIERGAREGLNVIYTGTVGIANGVEVLADLATELDRRGLRDIRFTVVGSGNSLAQVKERVNATGAKNVEFLPPVPKEEVAAMLANADVGIVTFAPFPVLEANSANKFYDYLASGLPILINYQGWQAGYLAEWNCGLSSKMGDLAALADNVERLRDPSLRAKMAVNARRLAETCFDRKAIARQLLQEFERILS